MFKQPPSHIRNKKQLFYWLYDNNYSFYAAQLIEEVLDNGPLGRVRTGECYNDQDAINDRIAELVWDDVYVNYTYED